MRVDSGMIIPRRDSYDARTTLPRARAARSAHAPADEFQATISSVFYSPSSARRRHSTMLASGGDPHRRVRLAHLPFRLLSEPVPNDASEPRALPCVSA